MAIRLPKLADILAAAAATLLAMKKVGIPAAAAGSIGGLSREERSLRGSLGAEVGLALLRLSLLPPCLPSLCDEDEECLSS